MPTPEAFSTAIHGGKSYFGPYRPGLYRPGLYHAVILKELPFQQ